MIELTRGEFLKAGAATVAATLLPQTVLAPSHNPTHKELTTADILGVHVAPYPGGSIYPDSEFSYMEGLGTQSATAINPNRIFMGRAKAAKIQVAARFYYEPKEDPLPLADLAEMTRLVAAYSDNPLILYKNEPNNTAETGGVYLPPERFVDDFLIPGAKEIIKAGGSPGLPTLDQTRNDIGYLTRILRRAVERESAQWILDNFFLAMHAYSFSGFDDPWNRISFVNQLVFEELGGHVPTLPSETGVAPDWAAELSEEDFAYELTRIASLKVPPELTVLGFNVWNLWNLRGRPEEDQHLPGRLGKEVWSFEPNALIGLNGPRQAYHDLVSLKQAS